tara:strand:- start:330 stop:473 length:144 start_codon:yes stop_codon:yes gene_type:complete
MKKKKLNTKRAQDILKRFQEKELFCAAIKSGKLEFVEISLNINKNEN